MDRLGLWSWICEYLLTSLSFQRSKVGWSSTEKSSSMDIKKLVVVGDSLVEQGCYPMVS